MDTLNDPDVELEGQVSYGSPPDERSDEESDFLVRERMDEMKDPAQEFAERVAEKWNSRVGNGMEGLVSTIANELREEGWKPGWVVQECEAGRL
jgi:hypothetical protein